MLYRRDYQRYTVNKKSSLVTKESEKQCFLKDLSARGACIIIDNPLEVNERVSIIIDIPGIFDKPVNKEAKVTWRQKIYENLW